MRVSLTCLSIVHVREQPYERLIENILRSPNDTLETLPSMQHRQLSQISLDDYRIPSARVSG
jgi:hypothetical protein